MILLGFSTVFISCGRPETPTKDKTPTTAGPEESHADTTENTTASEDTRESESTKEDIIASLFDDIDLAKSPFSLSAFDGKTTMVYRLPTADVYAVKKSIVERIKSAELLHTVPPEEGMNPVFYSLYIIKRGEKRIEIPFFLAFADGYLCVTGGQTYKTDINMEEFLKDFGYTKDESYQPIPVSRITGFAPFLKTRSGFRKEWLATDIAERYESREIKKGIKIEVTLKNWEPKGNVSLTITNNSEEDYPISLNPFYALLVKLDGVWYDVPYSPSPGYNMISMNNGKRIVPGQSLTLDINITNYYGYLPNGEYRLIKMDDADGYYDFRIGD